MRNKFLGNADWHVREDMNDHKSRRGMSPSIYAAKEHNNSPGPMLRTREEC
jgi:hypothetical protein